MRQALTALLLVALAASSAFADDDCVIPICNTPLRIVKYPNGKLLQLKDPTLCWTGPIGGLTDSMGFEHMVWDSCATQDDASIPNVTWRKTIAPVVQPLAIK